VGSFFTDKESHGALAGVLHRALFLIKSLPAADTAWWSELAVAGNDNLHALQAIVKDAPFRGHFSRGASSPRTRFQEMVGRLARNL
jgi:hypothetical protein